MYLIDRAKDIVTNKAVQGFTLNLASDFYDVFHGDVMAVARIIYALTSGIMTLHDNIFWKKFEVFLNGADMTEDELATFCKILSEDGTKPENITRVIDTIEKIDTNSKAKYLANASRCLSAGMITRNVFFRICHFLKTSLQEDLLFLQKEILENRDYEYDDTVQGLWSSGLMYQCFLNPDGNERYAFTPFAKMLDKYALSYDNLERYPMILEGMELTQPQQLSIQIGIPIEEF